MKVRIYVYCAAAVAFASPGLAQKKDELSDKTVTTLMQYAWAMTPPEYIAPDGKVVHFDKKKFNDATVPLAVAREVIRVGRLSAHAEQCGLTDAQTANYRTFMMREEAKGKWSEQQLVFMNQLHLFTLMTMTGQVKAVDSDQVAKETKEQAEARSKAQADAAAKEQAAAAAKCTDADRKRIEDMVTAYINSGPGQPSDKAGGPVKK